MRMSFVNSLSLLAGLVLVMVLAPTSYESVSGQANPCGMQLNQMPVIFCDTFDQPNPITNRSGQMNGVVWGVSRAQGGGTTWGRSTMVGCAGSTPVFPPFDVIICNGRVRASQWDMGGVTMLAMYPKQPFDFTGRTGTVSFDVTNDTSGAHGAWPEFWITDQPVPVPFVFGSNPCDFCTLPRNGFGLRFAGANGDYPGQWRADSVIVVRNYNFEEIGIFGGTTPSGLRIQQMGAVGLASGPNGSLNHVELRISQNQIDVYGSDPGSSTLRLINRVTGANLSLSRGLVWVGDAHYNANKSGGRDDQDHTYTWDNVAFDGPATYRDLSFDVLDRLAPAGTNVVDLGWSTPANLQTLPMTAANIAASRSAMLMFTYGLTTQPSTFNYTINGRAMSAPSPIPSTHRGMRSVALDVPLSALVAGPQSIALSANVPLVVSNVNIVLVAAAPVPGAAPVPSAPSNLRIISQAFDKVATWAGLLLKPLPQ
jgi:hypothetical protein